MIPKKNFPFSLLILIFITFGLFKIFSFDSCNLGGGVVWRF